MKARQLEDSLQRRTQELQALLRVGEELNQSLETNELLDLILFLTLDLLPGDAAFIYQFDEHGQLENKRHQSTGSPCVIAEETIMTMTGLHATSVIWPPAAPLVEGFVGGMALPLEYDSCLLGILILASKDGVFDENHVRLFHGIARQATLALRNANYASHLEEMVAARTEELRSAQQMLIRSEKLASVGHLAASIAHEINNPLQPIRIHLEHMLEDAHDGQPVEHRAIESIQESIERITRIVRQLLEFTGKRSPATDVAFFDIKRTLEGVISLNQKLFEQRNLKIVSFIDELPHIYGSKDQLEQVFMNLILNAQAALEPGGTLTISAGTHQDDVFIQFADDGCGIEEDKLTRIFDPFFSTKPNGTGLGLFVSYGIIQNHQGTIEPNSRVGEGTTFTIKLPIDSPAK
jgi:signal transduction histidine kinase